jgi:MSHA biogenesis protein MshJ
LRQRLQQLGERIDALSPRERLAVLAMLAAVMLFLMNLLLFDPFFLQQKQLAQRIEEQRQETRTLQLQIQALTSATATDPNAPQRLRLEALKKELGEFENVLRQRQADLVPPERIAQLLRDVLERNERLQLVSLATLPTRSLSELLAPSGARREAPPEGERGLSHIYRHGVEITVRGSYGELLRYVAALEELPWRMYWGKAQLTVDEYPASRLTLTLYTLSLDRVWLVV